MKKITIIILSILFIVLFISFVFIVFYPFKSKREQQQEEAIKPGIYVDIDLPSQAKTGEVIDYRIIVKNTGNCDLNVTVRDALGFKWTGTLTAGKVKEFKNSFEIKNAGTIENDVVVIGRYDNKMVKASAYDETLVNIAHYSLKDASDQGLVNFEFRGTGSFLGRSIELKIESNIDFEIEVEVEPGWILINSGSGQNMITAETSIIHLKPKIEVETKIVAYCLDMHKDAPSTNETFTLQQFSEHYGSNVQKLMKYVDKAPIGRKTLKAIQVALWVVIENVSKSDIRIFPPPSDSDICNAIWLLKNAGISIEDYELFHEMLREIEDRPVLPVKIEYNQVIEDNNAIIYGEVENLGDSAIEGVGIKIACFDENGSVTWLSSCFTMSYVLFPGEKSPFSSSIRVNYLGIDPSSFYCEVWVFKISKAFLKNYYRELELSNITVLREDSKMIIEGIVENAGSYEAKYVDIVISVYNSTGNLVGYGSDHISYIDIGQSKPFKIIVRLWGIADHWTIRVEASKPF